MSFCVVNDICTQHRSQHFLEVVFYSSLIHHNRLFLSLFCLSLALPFLSLSLSSLIHFISKASILEFREQGFSQTERQKIYNKMYFTFMTSHHYQNCETDVAFCKSKINWSTTVRNKSRFFDAIGVQNVKSFVEGNVI